MSYEPDPCAECGRVDLPLDGDGLCTECQPDEFDDVVSHVLDDDDPDPDLEATTTNQVGTILGVPDPSDPASWREWAQQEDDDDGQ